MGVYRFTPIREQSREASDATQIRHAMTPAEEKDRHSEQLQQEEPFDASENWNLLTTSFWVSSLSQTQRLN